MRSIGAIRHSLGIEIHNYYIRGDIHQGQNHSVREDDQYICYIPGRMADDDLHTSNFPQTRGQTNAIILRSTAPKVKDRTVVARISEAKVLLMGGWEAYHPVNEAPRSLALWTLRCAIEDPESMAND